MSSLTLELEMLKSMTYVHLHERLETFCDVRRAGRDVAVVLRGMKRFFIFLGAHQA